MPKLLFIGFVLCKINKGKSTVFDYFYSGLNMCIFANPKGVRNAVRFQFWSCVPNGRIYRSRFLGNRIT